MNQKQDPGADCRSHQISNAVLKEQLSFQDSVRKAEAVIDFKILPVFLQGSLLDQAESIQGAKQDHHCRGKSGSTQNQFPGFLPFQSRGAVDQADLETVIQIRILLNFLNGERRVSRVNDERCCCRPSTLIFFILIFMLC